MRLISNSTGKDSVRASFDKLASTSAKLLLAAPYFTYPGPLLDALERGSTLCLLVGLNSATHPDALQQVFQNSRISIRFYTRGFHAKLYVFDAAAMVGSANLTQAGFQSNREVMACFTEIQDSNAVIEAKTIFNILWDNARQLTPGTLEEFKNAWLMHRSQGTEADTAIAKAVGESEPPAISNNMRIVAGNKARLEHLRRQIEGQYKPAYDEIGNLLESKNLFRSDAFDIAPAFRINRFLNWVRLTNAGGDSWEHVPERSSANRQDEIVRLAEAWLDAADGKVDKGYAEGVNGVLAPFATNSVLAQASRDQITAGLLGIHAFTEQQRFTSGGAKALPSRFWAENKENVGRVRDTLVFLIHGHGDFVDRLDAVLSSEKLKLSLFGKFCALELYGTIKPAECPPVNGRAAKALRFLGFSVVAM